jgi:drug/metabolite transporter (DMT)-like permease
VTPLFAAASIYWDLPVLLVTFSLVYSATRHDRWDRILREALGWGLRVGGFLLVVGVALYVASSYPDYWPYLLGAGLLLAAAYTAASTVLHRRRPADAPR